ncbi:MAG: 1-acyl-sn-glycerol-3-phosphate acyltransferase [Fimbriimonadaceae bacterium]|nr:MAG: 1-acyl-sn-glycerol-3-phosphate acyltransferase [Fimbriimonadaceae bacterium]
MSRHSTTLRILYPGLKAVFWGLFALFLAPMRKRNSKNVPKTGPLLILANHISNTDPILVQYSCPRMIHFMARRELFDWKVLGPFLKWWRAFPVTQSAADTQAIRRAIELLEEGNAVCIFPEGQLSPDGKLIELLPGAHLIIRRTGVHCICVGLQGTNKLMPHPKLTPQIAASWLTATWGKPKYFDKSTSREDFVKWIESELLTLSGQPQKSSDGIQTIATQESSEN